MKLIRKKNSTSNIIHLFIQDSSKSDGSGKANIYYNSPTLLAYYIRAGAAAEQGISLVDITTLGTYVSGGFKQVQSTNMPGVYEFHPPDACFATGADQVVIMLWNVANMAPLPIEIQLDDNTAKDVYDRIGAPSGASIAADVAAITSDMWDELLTGATHNIPTSAGRRVREIGAFAIHSGTAQAGNSHSITLAATASPSDVLYNGIFNRNLIVITDNTGVGQTRTIVDYDAVTKITVIDRDWRISPDNTTAYQIVPDDTPLTVDHGVAQGGTARTITIRDYAASDDDAYLCNIVTIIAGTGRGQARLVDAYNGTTKVVTICGDDWVVTPDTTSIYAMMPYGVACAACVGTDALRDLTKVVGVLL